MGKNMRGGSAKKLKYICQRGGPRRNICGGSVKKLYSQEIGQGRSLIELDFAIFINEK